jgi:F-box-like
MSLVTYNPSNRLPDDVLLVIFDELDEEDLLRCETVCLQWRNVLLSGRPWKTLFRRQIVSSKLWRRVLQNFGVKFDNLETVYYRALCRAIIRQLNEIYGNWRTGNFKKFVESNLYQIATVEDDCVVCYFMAQKFLLFFERRSQKFTGAVKIPLGSFAVTNTEIVVVWDMKNMKILNTNGRLISEVQELDEDERIQWDLASCCLSGCQMAVISQSGKQEKLSLWDVSDPLKVRRSKSEYSNHDLQFIESSPANFEIDLQHNRYPSMKMDDQFIVISVFRIIATKFYFFSKKTLNLYWQKTLNGNMKNNVVYGKGLLLIYVSKQNDKSEEYGTIQVYDVASRTCIREMCITAKSDTKKLNHRVCFNSKFMVVAQESQHRPPCKLNICDLEAVKNPKSSEDEFLVHTVDVEFPVEKISIDETAIICQKGNAITMLDFGFFQYFRAEAKSVTLSLPWRSVWRSKGVDEEPLQPVRHMEVYKEVLKYFNELSMNCQTAIETHPVVDPDIASLTLGDDFIGYRRKPKMFIYDDKMKKRKRYMNYQTVQISKNRYVSVLGKTVQLIDGQTGHLINEMKLERDAIGFHFGGNLLVSVSKMAEHEHLLSIWRVENSSNFTQVKDVAIGDYRDSSEYEDTLQVDEHFIAVHNLIGDEEMACHIISLKTFQVERSLCCYHPRFYDRGYLFLTNNKRSLIRMLDVASGTFLHDMPVKPSEFVSIITRVNSNYVVAAVIESDSILYIYDLKCLKETDAAPTHLLLTTIELEYQVRAMLMNETRIVCLGKENMYVVDLKPIDRLRCPESC